MEHMQKNAKKPYEKPAIIYREKIEARANACSEPGKADTGTCPSGPITS